MSTIEVKVPDIGDFEDVPVIEVLVKPGDAVKAEDSLVTLESDKATMDVPSPSAGTVKALSVKVGDKVSEGTLILSWISADTATAATPAANAAPAQRRRPRSRTLPRERARARSRAPRGDKGAPTRPAKARRRRRPRGRASKCAFRTSATSPTFPSSRSSSSRATS